MPRPLPFDRWAIAILLAALPLRIALATQTCLSPDEAYYLAAHRLGKTIPDHPPLTPWLAGLADGLVTLPLELRVRLPALLLGTVISIVLVDLLRRRGGDPPAQRWAAILGSWLPLPLAGGFLLTPDTPLLLAVVVLLVIQEATGASRWKAPAIAVTCAIGLSAKVTMLVPAMVLFWMTRPRPHRAAVAVGVLAALPLAWPSLHFQSHHAFLDHEMAIGRVSAAAAAIGAQVALWGPAVLWLGAREAWRHALDRWVLLLMGALMLMSALLREVPPEPNWFAAGAVLCVAGAAQVLPCAAVWIRITTVLLGPVPTLLLASHVMNPWLPIPAHVDPSARLHGWRDGNGLAEAPGVGPYGPAAESCVYQGNCDELLDKIQQVEQNSSSAR